jgi:NAD(P)-dependent dehydrogenase (short-subunit alcohol dehydrogenase family)
MNYEGRSLLITGSNRGIGAGLVEGLLKRGGGCISFPARARRDRSGAG